MAEKKTLLDRSIRAMKAAPAGTRQFIADAIVPGLGIRITDKGNKTFIVRKKIRKKSYRYTLGNYPAMSLLEARTKAQKLLQKLQDGELATPTATRRMAETKVFEAVAERFIEQHLRPNTRNDEGERIVRTYLIPAFGDFQIDQIKRHHIADLMDDISAKKFRRKDGNCIGGPVMADRVLGRLRKLMNWYAHRDDDYTSPIIPGMQRTSDKDRARARILSDDEIRAFWAAAQRPPRAQNSINIFGNLARMLLLTAQRRTAVAGMCRSEIRDGIWHIPAERDKCHIKREIPLSATAQQILAETPIINGSDFVFTSTGENAFSGFSKSKQYLDNAMLKIMQATAKRRHDTAEIDRLAEISALFKDRDSKTKETAERAREQLDEYWWRLHDLRRTAKTLMVRAGVSSDISERALSHQKKGIEAVYDRWNYLPEIQDAFEKLESLILKIVTESPDN